MICSGVSLSRSSLDRASARARSARKRLPPVVAATVALPAILRKFRRPKQLQSRGCPSFWRMSDLHSNSRLERHYSRLLSARVRGCEIYIAQHLSRIVDVPRWVKSRSFLLRSSRSWLTSGPLHLYGDGSTATNLPCLLSKYGFRRRRARQLRLSSMAGLVPMFL